MLVAVGFLRMGPWELTGMEVAKVARQRFLDDVTDAVGQVFLGHMLQCARCHDHKFDPVPTRDYYSIQAVFATTQLAERAAPFLPVENTAGFEEKKYLQQRSASYQQTLAPLNKQLDNRGSPQMVCRERPRCNAVRAGRGGTSSTRPGARNQCPGGSQSAWRAQGASRSDSAAEAGLVTPQDFGLERVSRKGQERLQLAHRALRAVRLPVYNGRTPNAAKRQRSAADAGRSDDRGRTGGDAASWPAAIRSPRRCRCGPACSA